jgi:hypothetical protein
MTVGPVSSHYELFDYYTNYYTEPHRLTDGGKCATSVRVQIVFDVTRIAAGCSRPRLGFIGSLDRGPDVQQLEGEACD